MPMGPMGVSPRLMSQMGLRFPTGGGVRSPMRFPGPAAGGYFM